MKLERDGPSRLILSDGPPWPIIIGLGIFLLIPAIGLVQEIRLGELPQIPFVVFTLVPVAAILGVWVRSRTVFDKSTQHVTLGQSRLGYQFRRRQFAFSQIERVIVGTAAGPAVSDGAEGSPCFLIDGDIISLTYNQIGDPDAVIEMVAEMRAFLEHAAGDIVNESLEVLSRRWEFHESAIALAMHKNEMTHREARRLLHDMLRRQYVP
jgi:hypothetical protein